MTTSSPTPRPVIVSDGYAAHADHDIEAEATPDDEFDPMAFYCLTCGGMELDPSTMPEGI